MWTHRIFFIYPCTFTTQCAKVYKAGSFKSHKRKVAQCIQCAYTSRSPHNALHSPSKDNLPTFLAISTTYVPLEHAMLVLEPDVSRCRYNIIYHCAFQELTLLEFVFVLNLMNPSVWQVYHMTCKFFGTPSRHSNYYCTASYFCRQLLSKM